MAASFDFATSSGRRAWIRQLLAPMDEAKWNEMARELFAWQFAQVPAYRRLCRGHGVTPKSLTSWREMPAVPQQLFKRERLFAHGAKKSSVVYETSGTTTGQPGRQHLLSTDIYRAVSVEGAARTGLFAQVDFLHFLTPSQTDAPHSSLSAMLAFWREKHGTKRGKFWVHDNRIDFGALRRELAAQIKVGKPVGIAGTAFSFVHLIDAWVDLPRLKLPRGSWLLETGGFKGRSREVSKPELYAQLARTFGLRDVDIYNEYGMSELSSQAYTHGTRGGHELPPWARVLVVDPATGREVRVGQKGLVRWFDLANVDSVMALQTLDVAVRTTGGFHLMGRLPRTEPRGCSLSAEDLAQSASVIDDVVPAAGIVRQPLSITRKSTSPPPGRRRLPRNTTHERIDLLSHAYPRLFPRAELLRLVREQLGSMDAIEAGRVRAPQLIHHVCAGNLAVSAFTSLAHGLILGARNVVKLPSEREESTTRREIVEFIHGLPAPLRKLVEVERGAGGRLSDGVARTNAFPLLRRAVGLWERGGVLHRADAVIAFGSDATMESIRAQLRCDQKFIAHGHAVSLLWIAEPERLTARQARACAVDVLTYDQLGCLSPQAIYVPTGTNVEKLGRRLANALEKEIFMVSREAASPSPGRRRLPRRSPGTAARIAEARDVAFALGHRVWLPPKKHLGWTVVHDPQPGFEPSPLHGVIIIRQASEKTLQAALAPVAHKISTIGVVGKMLPRLREIFMALGVTRFCPVGRMQFPPLTWHHDGHAPLAELVTWIDREGEA